jgi:serine/threonine-protein kinase
MELVDGEDLSQRIARLRAPGASAGEAGMPLDEVLPIARQIAEALDADVWAFGAVLFERLSGSRAFAGDDVGETLASVIKGTVECAALPATVPPRVRRLIEGCLTRDRMARIPNMGVVRYALAEAGIDNPAAATAAGTGPMPSSRPLKGWLLAAACLVLGVLAGGAFVAWRRPSVEAGGARPAVRFVVSNPELPARLTNLDRNVAVSPDGSHVAYVSSSQLLVIRGLSDLEPTLTLEEPGGPRNPFFSPDGRWVGFYRNDQRDLARVAVSGGEAVSMGRIDQTPRGAVWAPDGSIILSVSLPEAGLGRMSAAGGLPELLTRLDSAQGEVSHAWPALLPGGAVLFTAWTGEPATSSVAVLDPRTGIRKTILRGGTSAQYIPSGHLVYASASALHAVRFDPDRLEVAGTPAPVVERLHTSAATRDGAVLHRCQPRARRRACPHCAGVCCFGDRSRARHEPVLHERAPRPRLRLARQPALPGDQGHDRSCQAAAGNRGAQLGRRIARLVP